MTVNCENCAYIVFLLEPDEQQSIPQTCTCTKRVGNTCTCTGAGNAGRAGNTCTCTRTVGNTCTCTRTVLNVKVLCSNEVWSLNLLGQNVRYKEQRSMTSNNTTTGNLKSFNLCCMGGLFITNAVTLVRYPVL